MLGIIREKAKGWIAWVIVILISIPFALWGINSYLQALNKVVVAKVNGTEIEGQAFQRDLDQQREQLLQATQGKIDSAILNSKAFKEQVLEGMIRRMLLKDAAADDGFRISDAQLRQLIESAPEFQSHGHFSREQYNLALRRAGYSDVGFEEQLRLQNEIIQMRNGFVESAFLTDHDINSTLRLQDQKRKFSYARIDPARFRKSIHVTEKEIADHYNEHKEDYRTPEQVKVNYVVLSVNDLAKDIKPTDAELHKAYQDNIDRYTTPAERRASHILIKLAKNADAAAQKKALEKAQELEKKLKSGASFSKLAREYSTDSQSAKKGGDLGYISKGMMVKPFEQALFALKPGEISAPVRSQYGYHIIKLTGIKPQERVPFAKVRGELEKQVAHKKAEDKYYEIGDTFKDDVYEHADSLEFAAKKLNLKVETSDWFGRKGGPGIAVSPKVVSAAFSDDVLHQRLNSDTIELGQGTLVAIHVVGYHESKILPLDQVRDRIKTRLVDQKAHADAVAMGGAAVAALKKGDSLAKYASANGLQVRAVGLVGRTGVENVNPALLDAVFKAARPKHGGSVYAGVDLGSEGYAVFALAQVVDGDPATIAKADKNKTIAVLAKRRGAEYFLDFERGLRLRGKIEIHPDKL